MSGSGGTAGAGASSGAPPGAGRGAAAACVSAADCGSPSGSPGWCTAAASCIAGRCVAERPLGGRPRTCSVASWCLDCGAEAAAASPASWDQCPVGVRTADLEASECPALSQDAGVMTLKVMRTAAWDCHYLLCDAASSDILGERVRLVDGEGVAEVASLGGRSTWRSLYTGAPRSLPSCPDCSVVLTGFD